MLLTLNAFSSSFMAPFATHVHVPSVDVKMAASAAAEPETVHDALVKLFSAYDTSSTGSLSLDEFTKKWVDGRGSSGDDEALTDAAQDWEARQARAGARRIRRLFTNGEDVTMESFVGHFQDEYEKRIERGLSTSQATAEIVCNMPQQALFAEMYGTE